MLIYSLCVCACIVVESTLKVAMATATSKDVGTSDVPLVTATATITTKANKSHNAVSKPLYVVLYVYILYTSSAVKIIYL